MGRFKNYISRLLIFITAIQILNTSIDAPNAKMQSSDGAIDTFNYIDSFVEYVSEIVLDFHNAIPESNHRDHREIQMHKHVQIAVLRFQPSLEVYHFDHIRTFYHNSADNYAYQYIREINPPPPKGCSALFLC